MAEQRTDERKRLKDLGRITGDDRNSTASTIGRGGDSLVQDDIAYGTEVDRAGTEEERERIRDERKVP